MRKDARTRREAEVAAAAYAVIEEKGYAGASMLTIARRARASNETLYNWYGDKQGLFRSLIERNTQDVRRLLETAAQDGAAPLEVLRQIGPKLLAMVLGERAIALNRAASADPTGELGRTLAEAGREAIAPRIGAILQAAHTRGDLRFDDPEEAVNTYVSLLVGDLQIRRATGAVPGPNEAEIATRAGRAMTQFLKLYGP